jgi:hypothetical protein
VNVERVASGPTLNGFSSGPARLNPTPPTVAVGEIRRAAPAFRDAFADAVATATAPRQAPRITVERPAVAASHNLSAVGEEEKSRLDAGAASLAMSGYLREQEQIEAHPSQAILSVSINLRECAQGVDELRNQVDMVLLKLCEQQNQISLPPSPPGISAIPGILGRFAKRCFFRLLGRSSDLSVISHR